MTRPVYDPSPRTFHLLTEAEPFSEQNGGAISRWVANVLRTDTHAVVLAPSADDTWSFPHERLRTAHRLLAYKRLNDRAGRLLRWPIRRRLLLRALRPALDDLQPGDLVWVHNRPEFAAAIEPLVHARGARLILHLHNAHLLHWPKRWVYALHADAFVFVSHFLRQHTLATFPHLGRCEVLHNGADQSIFYPRIDPAPRPGPPVVVFAGRLVPDKGLHVFLDAMRLLQRRAVPIEGIVFGGSGFGSSKPTPYLREMQRTSPSNVTFQPYCAGSALGERFREADLACVPSCWQDPMPLVVLEAMASGLPVIASRSGGIPEMLAAGGGILVERGYVEPLADALQQAATDAHLRQRLSQEACASVQSSFTWDIVRKNYRSIVQSVSPADKTSEAS